MHGPSPQAVRDFLTLAPPVSRIERPSVSVAALHYRLTIAATPAVRPFLDLRIVVGTERAQVLQRVRAAPPAAKDVVDMRCWPPTPNHDATAAIPRQSGFAKGSPCKGAVEGVSGHLGRAEATFRSCSRR